MGNGSDWSPGFRRGNDSRQQKQRFNTFRDEWNDSGTNGTERNKPAFFRRFFAVDFFAYPGGIGG